jgi:hypothetical protein
MSKWPQRSVSVSDQTWICFFGVSPEVLCERIVSDIIQPPIQKSKNDQLSREAPSHDKMTLPQFKAIIGLCPARLLASR